MILITGGLGYLGGRIAEYLIKSGEKVVIGTRKIDAVIPDELIGCNIVEIDMLKPKTLQKACDGITTIIHLAGMNAKECSSNPEQALLVNGLGTLNLLNAAKVNKVRKFLYFSTVHVYGSPLSGDIDENLLPRPVNPYSITHRLAEDYVIESARKGEISGYVFRLSNVIGRPLSKGANCWTLLANDLCKQVAKLGKLKLNAQYLIQRDFISIYEICRTISFFLNNDTLSTKDEIYNLSSNRSTTLKDLSNLIASRAKKIIGIKPQIIYHNIDNMEDLLPLNISNAKITNLGISISQSIVDEIDDLLISCKRWYK